MTKKVRENFYILLFSNVITLMLVLLFDNFWKEANSMGNEIFSLLNIPYYLLFAIIVSLFLCLLKDNAPSDIIVNNNIQPMQICNNLVDAGEADAIREKYNQEIMQKKLDIVSAVV